MPAVAVSAWPSVGVPEIAGTTVFCGGIAAMTAVAGDVAEAGPAAFSAVTTTRRRDPMSAGVRSCVTAVAPSMSVQAPPVASQRRHW